ncbi:MAG TPA: ATP-binding protein, partial [Phycisphaerae bacterium]|nr:ATP-binding protein [Phycisphaerae bacterium]
TAIRTARPVACNDFQADPHYAPWHSTAAAMGFASSVALSLRNEGKAFGALNLYSSDPGAFHEQEVELLQEMADNVTYGIQALRGQAQQALAEEALRRSEERFRQFFEDAPIGIEIYNAKGKLVDANRACLEIFGISDLSNVLGFDLFEDPNLPDGIKRDVRRGQAVRYETTFSFDLVREKKLYPTSRTGTISLSVLVTPLHRPEETAPNGYMVHVQDITARKQAEQRAQNLARFPAENPNPVLRVAENGTILYANPAGSVLLNAWSSGVGQTVPEGLHKRLSDALVAGQREMLELQLDDRTFAITVAPIAEARYVNLYALDITDRKELEDQLRQSQKMEAVGQLAGGIAHDFNNQLTVMRGYCDLILREKEGGENLADWRHHASEIRSAVDRAAMLTGQLLAFSRRQMLQPKVLNLNEQLKAFSTTLGRIIGENIRLVLDCQDDLWNASVDPAHFDQTVMNLVLNARDAMPDGGQLTLETRNVELGEDYARQHPGMSPGPHVMIAVSDTGAGMSEETQRRAFEPFYTTKPQGQGSGLGLAMVYGFVKQSHGAVYLYSEPGKGTTFKIYLPRSETAPVSVAPSPNGAQQTLRGDETILLAEDDVGVRQLAVRILEQFGYTVLATTNPQEALALANDSQRRIDLLITDVIMPGMSGPELARNIGLVRPDLEVLYVSGYTQNAILHHGVIDKGVNLLTKPFGPMDLAGAVRRTLDRHKPSPPPAPPGGA